MLHQQTSHFTGTQNGNVAVGEVGDFHLGQLLKLEGELDGEIVATAIFYRSADTLYGRYWGASVQINALHFETCYLQGIEYCIQNGIKRFNPGTQGEHKISRGFSPASTWSAHWLLHDGFASAIGEFLDEEQRHIDRYMDVVGEHLPYKNSERQQ